ncbi:4-(cytidine 5'-diphospho)-2-C-methyl-D-erythritol kinase [Ferrimonas sp. SCSIO 43195]|uniref:4-(cytidine 5'-diphospho)-2-C-methyl-D-erythritol kinase n=1 Tax=Ferrimonas sp. SCSIO 43195 TaxID=2822844 RepID=UPI002075A8A1|nr:4-(cytidine 5'-diphospho)-2-C-methyl-D-erythritol kinase [Ferrimonas sp. SCSIO 43195]USD38257.1 4-(cytidine 5'-diphospho)-2-C-methyl-D-erythritol kinase [Ferrimonas sp. SCSIO 43195]
MPTSSRNWPAPAKLNLFLHINGRRQDGYHELQSLFQFVDHCDQLHFTVRQDADITLSPAIDGVANDDNLIVRAARLLQSHCDCSLGVDIELEKVLPMGGGLGGGSSNAATTLVALNRLWQLNLGEDQLAELGLSLGADVPVFVRGLAAVADGVGEILRPVEIAQPWYLVVAPNVAVSTAEIFQAPELTRNSPKLAQPELRPSQWHNDCVGAVIQRYGQVANALGWLIQYAPSQMTGTGSCIFGTFSSQEEALVALADLPDEWRGFVARGCNRSPLLDRALQP